MNKTAVLAVLNQQYEARIQRIADLRYNVPESGMDRAKQALHDRLFEEAKQLLKDMDFIKSMSPEQIAAMYGIENELHCIGG